MEDFFGVLVAIVAVIWVLYKIFNTDGPSNSGNSGNSVSNADQNNATADKFKTDILSDDEDDSK